MDVVAEVMGLKKEVADILTRYNVPMDDRDFILEKLDRAVSLVMTAQKNAFENQLVDIRKEIEVDRNQVRKEVEGIRGSALSKLSGIRSEVDRAYEEGVSDGMSQAPSSVGPSTFTIVLGIFFAALAVTVVAGGLFSPSGKK